MSQPIVKVENLGKKYTISHEAGNGYTALRDVISKNARNWVIGNKKPLFREDFWALKNISFEVKQGDAIGIIGRNGAGKSTLLKLLSRITEPSIGRIEIKGRIASLLEVGTGFHPELTGRENIFLNGAILGMSRLEIKRKFDEIVDFSGVERFLDTPVKRFSSGMYVRLAFSVAAHLEPEILIVDEVLAVGDAEFQKKCLGRMDQVAKKEGRTVLFVSHNMGAIQSLCSSVIMLKNGSIVEKSDNVKKVIDTYLFDESELQLDWNLNRFKSELVQNEYFLPHRISIVDSDLNSVLRPLANNEKFGLMLEGELLSYHSALCIGFDLYNEENILLFRSLATDRSEEDWPNLEIGVNKLVCWLPKHFFNEGKYRVVLNVSLHYIKWLFDPMQNSPTIVFTIKGGLSNSPYWYSARPGLLAPILKFEKT
jgi:lipopolysaccharide transport system ATP-binding protein